MKLSQNYTNLINLRFKAYFYTSRPCGLENKEMLIFWVHAGKSFSFLFGSVLKEWVEQVWKRDVGKKKRRKKDSDKKERPDQKKI